MEQPRNKYKAHPVIRFSRSIACCHKTAAAEAEVSWRSSDRAVDQSKVKVIIGEKIITEFLQQNVPDHINQYNRRCLSDQW